MRLENFLHFTIDQAQALSFLSLGLFVVMVALAIPGLTIKLNKSATHWLAMTAFSCCILLSILTSMLYFWHRHFRG